MDKKTKKLVLMGMLVALSVALVYFIHMPIIPGVYFLEYDPADIPILIGTFLFGPLSGVVLTVLVSVIQGVTVSAQAGIIGIVMHIVATSSLVLVAGLFYRKGKKVSRAVIGLTLGSLTMTGVMVAMNLILTPIFMGQPMETVVAMLLPAIIPFNLLKAGINSALSFVLFKGLERVVK